MKIIAYLLEKLFIKISKYQIESQIKNTHIHFRNTTSSLLIFFTFFLHGSLSRMLG